eukprot:SAG22_NODE_989_length_6137_cov_5.207519_2_plen_533_part_00
MTALCNTDLFEARPLPCGTVVTDETKDLPEKEQELEERLVCDKTLNDMRIKMPRDKRGNGSCKGMIIDMILMGKLPHGLAVLATLAVSIGGLGSLFGVIGADVAKFFEKETCKTTVEVETLVYYSAEDCTAFYDPAADTMGNQLVNMGNDFITALTEAGVNIKELNALDYGDDSVSDKFGVPIQRKNASVYQIVAGEQDIAPRYVSSNKKPTPRDLDNGALDRRQETDLLATVTILNLWDYQPLPYVEDCRDTEKGHPADEYCARSLQIFGGPDIGTPWGELLGTVATVGDLLNQVVVVLMLAMFIIMERPEGRTVSGDHKVLEEIEDMIKNYINLKTILSFVTGVVVAIFLMISSTPLGMIFGVLSFLLNFIPNVGSAIACILPLPIIALSDQAGWEKAVAVGGPMLVQLYVGNALEPQVFGEALNLSAISILLALVIMAYMWGLPGAVLSVPFLGIMKISAHHTDHPQAKYFLKLIRESYEVDVEKDQFWATLRRKRDQRDAAQEALMVAREKELGSYPEPDKDDEEAQD